MIKKSVHNLKLIPILIILFLLPTIISAQIHEGYKTKFGISAVLQTEQVDLLFPIWASNRFVVIPSFKLARLGDIATDFGLGVGLRSNFSQRDAVPYVGFRAAILMLTPDNNESTTDFVYGPFFGGEYFFSSHFSASVEAQLNFSKSGENSLRFGNPDGTNFNTATVAMVSFYF